MPVDTTYDALQKGTFLIKHLLQVLQLVSADVEHREPLALLQRLQSDDAVVRGVEGAKRIGQSLARSGVEDQVLLIGQLLPVDVQL